MGGRGMNRNRGGRVISKAQNHARTTALDRLGARVNTYHSANTDRISTGYRYVRQSNTNSSPSTFSIAPMPPESRIKIIAKKFLTTYYSIFDQPGRANLDSLYNADAFFSVSSTYPMPSFGRNLLEVREADQRVSLLVHNKTNIAGVLAAHFSPTEHSVDLLTMDVPFYIANPMSVISIQVVVNGVYKDITETTNPLKAFTRVFILKLVSVNDQGEPVYEIFNDLFMLQLPTPEQIKKYHRDAQIAKRPNATTSDLTKGQEAMLVTVMTKTKMNRAGSRQLLEEHKWNLQASMSAFNQLYSSNQIPQELFKP